MRACIQCEVNKDDDCFYVSNKSRCKDCVKARVRAHRLANLDRIQEWDRERGFRGNGVVDPIKRKANTAVGNAVRDGRLIKPSVCCDCGGCGQRIEAHHEDYTKPLAVVWLCSRCHGLRHRKAA